MTIGAFIGAILPKLGINTADADLAEALALGLDFPDNLANPIVTKINAAPLLTLEAARNNPDLKNKFKAEALNGMDSALATLMSELQLGEDVVSEINGTGNTYQKVPALVKKIKELEVAKAAAASKDKPELTQQINALNQKLAEIQTSSATALAQKEQQHLDEMTELLLDGKIRSKNLNTSVFPADTVVALARLKLTEELQNKGVKIKNVNRTLQLKQAAEEGLDYYENNTPVTIDSMIEQVLANNKLLAVSGPTPPVNTTGLPPIFQPSAPGSNTPRTGMASKLDTALAAFQTGSTGVV